MNKATNRLAFSGLALILTLALLISFTDFQPNTRPTSHRPGATETPAVEEPTPTPTPNDYD